MKTVELLVEIEAYAAAKASGNQLLLQRQKQMLETALNKLPEELPEKETQKNSGE
jgi:hypothetical protein